MRLRRKNAENDQVEELDGELDQTEEVETPGVGPIDIEDIDPDRVYIDLGSMLIPADTDLELRLQVDEETSNVVALLLVGEEGVLEARAFASSRGGDLWSDARREIAADTAQRGGTATEQEGSFGTELYCEVPVTGPDGESLVQPSRVVGHNGPRWFVRATIAGRPAQDPDYAVAFEDAVRSMAVRRGAEAMAPGEPLPLRLPPEARPLEGEDADFDALDD